MLIAVAAYGYNGFLIGMKTIFMIGLINIYKQISYGVTAAISSFIASFILKNIRLSVISSAIISILTASLGIFLSEAPEWYLAAKIVIIIIVFSAALLGSFSDKIFDTYNKIFQSPGGAALDA